MKCMGALGAVMLSQTVFADVSDVVKTSEIKGGIVVHLDCNDGEETAKLLINNNLCVQGLDTSEGDIAATRKYLTSQGLYGKVTANLFDGKKLPYADDLVNITVSESATQVPDCNGLLNVPPDPCACHLKMRMPGFKAYSSQRLGSVGKPVSLENRLTAKKLKLDGVPVSDGMSVAEGKLFISLKNGAVTCYGE